MRKLSPRKILCIIEAVAYLTLLVAGSYLLSPFYVAAPGTSISAALTSEWAQRLLGVVYVLPSALGIYALWKNKLNLREWATLGTFIGYLFITLLRLITIGPIPILWVFTFALTIIVGLIHILLRQERENV